jgi:hypothetical protein
MAARVPEIMDGSLYMDKLNTLLENKLSRERSNFEFKQIFLHFMCKKLNRLIYEQEFEGQNVILDITLISVSKTYYKENAHALKGTCAFGSQT